MRTALVAICLFVTTASVHADTITGVLRPVRGPGSGYVVIGDGQTYQLSIRGDEKLMAKVQALARQRVIVTGVYRNGIFHVNSIRQG